MLAITDNPLINDVLSDVSTQLEDEKITSVLIAVQTNKGSWKISFNNMSRVDLLGIGEFIKEQEIYIEEDNYE